MLDRVKRLTGFWLPLAILCPSLIWVALDHAVWPWDQAWFGAQTVVLYETLRADPLEWPVALSRATPIKPPAVAWIGQFFVPLGSAVGSVDAGLLLSVWACHLVALMVIFRALFDLSGGRIPVASAGTLVVGAAPIFIALSTQYLAEASQTLAVAWFVLIMARAPRWSRSMLGAHVVGATCFAMLAKTTSPLYCVAPGLVALIQMVRRSSPFSAADRGRHQAASPWWALALLLAAAGTWWYDRNFEAVLHHVRTAAFGSVAAYYGQNEPFIRGLRVWILNASSVFFLEPVAALLGMVVFWGVAKRLFARPAVAAQYRDLCAAAAFVQALVALAVFALSPNRDPRYVAPLLPLVAVVVSWAILNSGLAWAAHAVMGVLALQLALVQGQVLRFWPGRPAALRAALGVDEALSLVHRDRRPAADLKAIVQRTCPPRFAGEHFVGVDLLELSGHALTYATAKERLAGRGGQCHYESIGFGSVESAEGGVNARSYFYWITVDPQVRPIPGYHAFLNESAPVVFERLRRRGVLESEPWDGAPTGIRLFRFVKR